MEKIAPMKMEWMEKDGQRGDRSPSSKLDPGFIRDNDQRRGRLASSTGNGGIRLSGTGCVGLCWAESDGVYERLSFLDLVECGDSSFQLCNPALLTRTETDL